MGELSDREVKVQELSKEILTTIKVKAIIENISPQEALCALTNVFMGGFAALRTNPKDLKDLFQLLLTDYAEQYEVEEHKAI